MEYLINGDLVNSKKWAKKLAIAFSKSYFMKEQFDDFLIKNNKPFIINEIEYSFDIVLKKIDRKHYNKLFIKYCEDESFYIINNKYDYNDIINEEHFIAIIKEEME
jgi:hypothetical protein